MATTTQARITDETRERVARIARQTGKSQQEVIEAAVKNYEIELFLDQVNESYAALREDADAWAEETADREKWDVALEDGSED